MGILGLFVGLQPTTAGLVLQHFIRLQVLMLCCRMDQPSFQEDFGFALVFLGHLPDSPTLHEQQLS